MNDKELHEKRDYICEIIENLYGISKESLLSNKKGCRKREYVQFRRIISVLLKKYTTASLAAIGKAIGGKDHATVLHALRKHDERTAKNPKSGQYIYQDYVDRFMTIHLEYLQMESTEESLHSKRHLLINQIQNLKEELESIDFKLKQLHQQRIEQIKIKPKKVQFT